MHQIDLRTVLHRRVSAGYGDLVTRRTGEAVRGGVEEHLAEIDGNQVAVIDFSSVRCLDFSCADEIVGKLLLTHGHARYFVLRGVTEGHREAIEQILERYGLAVVIQDRTGQMDVLGVASETVRRAFAVVAESGTADVADVALRLAVPDAAARETLRELLERRLALGAPDSGAHSLV